MTLGALRWRDIHRAIRFAIIGMHFDWYFNNRFLLWLYGYYFWFLEYSRATRVIAAYANGRLVGVLLAEVYGEAPLSKNRWMYSYVRAFEWLAAHFFKGGPDLYERTTIELLHCYRQYTRPDGEIIFLAADQNARVRGIGTVLLRDLETAMPGKTFFLQTDNACTYQFYEHRGFERAEEKTIVLTMPKGSIPLDCFLYSKTFPTREA